MGVLHRLAHGPEELQPFTNGESLVIAMLRERNPVYQFHHEVRAAGGNFGFWIFDFGFGRDRLALLPPFTSSGSAIKYLCNVWVVHQRQRLALGLKARHHLPRVHPQLDHFQRDAASE